MAGDDDIFADMESLFPELAEPPRQKPPVSPQFSGTATPPSDATHSLFPEISLQDGVSLDEVDAAMGLNQPPPPLKPTEPETPDAPRSLT